MKLPNSVEHVALYFQYQTQMSIVFDSLWDILDYCFEFSQI